MLDNLKKYQIILASNSPRRKELMSGLGVDYVVRTLPDVDESYPDTLVGAEIPEYDGAGRIIDYSRYYCLDGWKSTWKTGG